MRVSRRGLVFACGLLAFVFVVGAAVAAFDDWGLEQQTQLENKSQPLFGVGQPLTASSKESLTKAQATADPAGLVTLAKGLERECRCGRRGGNVGAERRPDGALAAVESTHIIARERGGDSASPGCRRSISKTGEATTIAERDRRQRPGPCDTVGDDHLR